MSTIQYKQSAPEVIRAVSEVEDALASKGKVIHIINKPDMTQSQLEQASANRAAIEVHLFQNFRTDGLIDATFDTLWRTVRALYQSGSVKAETEAGKGYKPVLVSTTGKVSHAHKEELDVNAVLNRQQQSEQMAEERKQAQEIWQQCEAVIQAHRHFRNHAVTQRDQQTLLATMKSLYTETGRYSRAQAYDALVKIKDLSRRLGEKH